MVKKKLKIIKNPPKDARVIVESEVALFSGQGVVIIMIIDFTSLYVFFILLSMNCFSFLFLLHRLRDMNLIV